MLPLPSMTSTANNNFKIRISFVKELWLHENNEYNCRRVEETKPTTYLKMETQWKDYDARLLIRCVYMSQSMEGPTLSHRPSMCPVKLFHHFLKRKKGWLIWQAFD